MSSNQTSTPDSASQQGSGDMQAKVVTIIGRKNAGKTALFSGICDSVNQGLHGYKPSELVEFTLTGQRDRINARRRVAEGRHDASSAPEFNMMRLRHRFDAEDASLCIEAWDTMGEGTVQLAKLFREANGVKSLPNEHQTFKDALEKSDGIIFAVSPFDLNDGTRLADIESFLALRGEMSDVPKAKNFVIALTMIDLLLLPFRDLAVDLAMDHDLVLKLIAKFFESRMDQGYLSDFNDQAEAWGAGLHFMATSGFGCLLEHGCANLRVDGEHVLGDESRQPLPLMRNDSDNGYTRFPLFVADPFIIAATGRVSNFAYKFSELQSVWRSERPRT
jgi:hypothetical protein